MASGSVWGPIRTQKWPKKTWKCISYTFSKLNEQGRTYKFFPPNGNFLTHIGSVECEGLIAAKNSGMKGKRNEKICQNQPFCAFQTFHLSDQLTNQPMDRHDLKDACKKIALFGNSMDILPLPTRHYEPVKGIRLICQNSQFFWILVIFGQYFNLYGACHYHKG